MQSDIEPVAAIFYDPVKVEEEAGYPSPALESVLRGSLIPFRVVVISLQEILCGALLDSGFTMICIPGGFAPNFVSRLGPKGLTSIRDFVSAGGGYVGICAGAYLGSVEGLALLPIEIVDVDCWARGNGPCQLQFTADGATAIGALSGSVQPVTVRYANGPIMRICGSGVATLAAFATEFRGWRGDYAPKMIGTPAIAMGRCNGTGGVVALVSPHMEDGMDERSLTPLCNLFHLASRASLTQQWLVQPEAGASLELYAALSSAPSSCSASIRQMETESLLFGDSLHAATKP